MYCIAQIAKTILRAIHNRGLPKVVFLAEAEAEAEGRKNFGLRPKTEAEAEGSTLGSFN